jgi:hypothetical protein
VCPVGNLIGTHKQLVGLTSQTFFFFQVVSEFYRDAIPAVTHQDVTDSNLSRSTGWLEICCDLLSFCRVLFPAGAGNSPPYPEQLWGPPSLLSNGALSLGVKRPGREADRSPPSSAEVKECVELYLHSPIRLHDVVLS